MSNDETQIIKMKPEPQAPPSAGSTPDTTLWTWPFVTMVGIMCGTVVAVAWICSGAF